MKLKTLFIILIIVVIVIPVVAGTMTLFHLIIPFILLLNVIYFWNSKIFN